MGRASIIGLKFVEFKMTIQENCRKSPYVMDVRGSILNQDEDTITVEYQHPISKTIETITLLKD